MFSETPEQVTKEGKKFVEVLKEKGIYSGIKVDKGVQDLPCTPGETSTKGLDTLDKMTKDFYDIGCRFAKWRSVLKIDTKTGCPSEQAIQENAWQLARYAAICQKNGLVPIVEPEILADGDHSIDVCQKATERVLGACFRALQQNNIFFEGCLLKPNMVTPGNAHPERKNITPQEIGTRTAIALSRTVVPALVGVMFLSGGQSEEEASLNLNAINQLQNVRRPYFLSFSYGRALQNSVIKAWQGKDENLKAAQDALIVRAKANSEAQLGKYAGSDDKSAKESLVVEHYVY